MKSNYSLLASTFLQPLNVAGFSPASILQRFECAPPNKCLIPSQSPTKECRTRFQAATATSPTDTKVQVNTEVPVSRISVCAGELCQCQGEQYEYTGGASDAAIEELHGLGLPFPVDEVGCLGACGMGTMIAIDYDNGDSIMTDGLQSTLVELGIERQKQATLFASETENGTTENGAVAEASVNINGETTAPSILNMAYATNTADAKERVESSKRPLLLDARDRMREEAAGQVENPWINMASYLAKKAAGNIFGSE
mmetsp:Transcript_3222/g.6167  ORF Transcript_3222/g.6167 Transcript_3222/m.6167 type:complete len:256 (+) Transcript_3222:307-1074(+)|eukprot:CAMPEP_0201683994 /NCGR_PEP_ID=MMETSP0494-20130426/52410_1 /ASSEMBLY_ACC=CAM_ASM_000839 /TAXON_ID=420259 /ORGANISM="Thalassiosira gravida, Strain GMp14c1" /LENGTH=255 /DNA_ID=CAMNT_0048167781 /DNA_START=239 /DNA_END=1006 /DNA_ORIENTATION=-